MDEAKASFQQLGFKRFSLMRLLPRLCSSKWKTANEEAKAKGLGGNLKGDGGQTGGVLVVGQGGAPTMFTYKQVNVPCSRILEVIHCSHKHNEL